MDWVPGGFCRLCPGSPLCIRDRPVLATVRRLGARPSAGAEEASAMHLPTWVLSPEPATRTGPQGQESCSGESQDHGY